LYCRLEVTLFGTQCNQWGKGVSVSVDVDVFVSALIFSFLTASRLNETNEESQESLYPRTVEALFIENF
jgi:hypothetical protein